MAYSKSFLEERKRFYDQWRRVSAILKEHRKKFGNKVDVLSTALDLLEEKLNVEEK